MKQEISERIDKFIELWNTKNVEHTKKNFSNLTAETLSRRDGKKFVKIVKGNNSAYAFINGETGEIFMPASWAAPAKHARGNVMADDYGISCSGPYGIVYLRGGSIGW